MTDQMQRHLDEVVNKSWNFSGKLAGPQDHFLNAMIGLASESGEALDIHKKIWFHTGKDLTNQRDAIKSELGDVAFYWLKAVDLHEFTIAEVLADNRAKLAGRHPLLIKG